MSYNIVLFILTNLKYLIMKKTFFIAATFAALLISCEKAMDDSVVHNIMPQIKVMKHGCITTVNLNIVRQAAVSSNLVMNRNSRSKEEKEIKEIIPITDSLGRTMLYVVNYKYDKGYVIFSGNNEYHPVLAYNENGNFYIKKRADYSGAYLWLQEQKEAVKNVKSLPDSIRLRNKMAWNHIFDRTEYSQLSVKKKNSRAVDPDLEYQVGVYIEESLQKWSDEGYTIYSYGSGDLAEIPESEADAIRTALEQKAEDRFFGGFDGTVYIRVKNKVTKEKKGPLLKSTWNQVGTYGEYTPNGYAGCSAVAVGQIMRYHEYPTSYNWDAMAYNYPTDVTAQFLYEIGLKENMDYTGSQGSPASINDACSAFRQYGYTSSKVVNHASSTIMSQIRNFWPIYMRGTTSGEDKGHAWVCDGFDYTCYDYPYEVMAIDKSTFDYTGKPYYRCIYSYNVMDYSTYFHMNWGWGGLDNGYFDDSTLKDKKYLTARKDIINIHP